MTVEERINKIEETQDDCVQRISKCEVRVDDTILKLDRVIDKLDAVCDRLAKLIGERDGRNRLIDIGIGAVFTGAVAVIIYVIQT